MTYTPYDIDNPYDIDEERAMVETAERDSPTLQDLHDKTAQLFQQVVESMQQAKEKLGNKEAAEWLDEAIYFASDAGDTINRLLKGADTAAAHDPDALSDYEENHTHWGL